MTAKKKKTEDEFFALMGWSPDDIIKASTCPDKNGKPTKPPITREQAVSLLKEHEEDLLKAMSAVGWEKVHIWLDNPEIGCANKIPA